MNNDKEIDNTHSLEFELEDMLVIIQSIRFWGAYARTHPDCTPISHTANQFMMRLRKQIQDKYPDYWKQINEHDTLKFMLASDVKPSLFRPTKPKRSIVGACSNAD